MPTWIAPTAHPSRTQKKPGCRWGRQKAAAAGELWCADDDHNRCTAERSVEKEPHVAIAVEMPFDDPDLWVAELRRRLPSEDFRTWPDIGDPSEIEFVVMWKIPAEELSALPNLRAILLTGAGTNHLRPIEDYPDVPVVRLADQTVASDMAAYAVHWVLHFHRGMDVYRWQQGESTWQRHRYRPTRDFTVGVLGMGNIGGAVADAALALGYPVRGWSASGRERDGVTSFSGDALDEFLSGCDALINVLPLTSDTYRLLNTSRLAQLPKGACVINVGRGGTIDHDALVAALDAGRLSGAALDVFSAEPLPEDSPLWSHPRVALTPHISGSTMPETATDYIATNITRMRSGEEPFPILDRTAGY